MNHRDRWLRSFGQWIAIRSNGLQYLSICKVDAFQRRPFRVAGASSSRSLVTDKIQTLRDERLQKILAARDCARARDTALGCVLLSRAATRLPTFSLHNIQSRNFRVVRLMSGPVSTLRW